MKTYYTVEFTLTLKLSRPWYVPVGFHGAASRNLGNFLDSAVHGTLWTVLCTAHSGQCCVRHTRDITHLELYIKD